MNKIGAGLVTIKKRRRKPDRALNARQLARRGLSLARRLANPTQHMMIIGSAAPTSTRTGVNQWSGLMTIPAYSSSSDGVGVTNGSGVEIWQERLTNIAQGDDENNREGDTIFMKSLKGELLFEGIRLTQTPTPMVDGSGTIHYYPSTANKTNTFVRILVVRFTDETNRIDADYAHAPPLSDIFDGIITEDPGATATTASTVNMLQCMFGSYKKESQTTQSGNETEDQRLTRVRKFEVLYDKLLTLTMPADRGIEVQEWEARKTAVGVARAEAEYMTYVKVPIDVPINRKVTYITSDSTDIDNIEGNIYFGLYATHVGVTAENILGTTGAGEVGDNWFYRARLISSWSNT